MLHLKTLRLVEKAILKRRLVLIPISTNLSSIKKKQYDNNIEELKKILKKTLHRGRPYLYIRFCKENLFDPESFEKIHIKDFHQLRGHLNLGKSGLCNVAFLTKLYFLP